uniref:Conotoxin Im5.4 n=2 Tax=Conus TaxID=6490 RepID=CT54_CONIM|nr:RecName: Full=Conotoxin Im5.4; AltName: Full=Conopeptide im023; Flags: Precursor [Conus imperialis]QFQ61124.1 conotoxin superfamily T [Conus magus]UMA82312.1 conotoxin precursor T [Conus ebraeus]UMA83232.1 conotoxin precursor T [Conus judaeus]ADZ74140.1 conotoxin Im5.4 [Conus imperialis]AME17681.1 conopeptide im023 [Conus imperialis]
MRCLPVVVFLLLLLSAAAAPGVGSKTERLPGLTSSGDSDESLPFLNTICCWSGACCGG